MMSNYYIVCRNELGTVQVDFMLLNKIFLIVYSVVPRM